MFEPSRYILYGSAGWLCKDKTAVMTGALPIRGVEKGLIGPQRSRSDARGKFGVIRWSPGRPAATGVTASGRLDQLGKRLGPAFSLPHRRRPLPEGDEGVQSPHQFIPQLGRLLQGSAFTRQAKHLLKFTTELGLLRQCP